MKFDFLSGDVDWCTYGGKWVSERLDSGLFNYWLVLDFLNLEEAGARDDDDDAMYHCAIEAVAPDLLGFDKIEELMYTMDLEWLEEWYYRQSESNRMLLLIDEASIHGYYGPCAFFEGNDWRNTIISARRRAAHVATYPWSYWNRQANMVGSTVYDFMSGDIMAGVRGYTDEENSLDESYGLAYRNIQRVMEERVSKK